MTVVFRRGKQNPGEPKPGPLPYLPVTARGKTYEFGMDSGSPQTIVDNRAFNLPEKFRRKFSADGPEFPKFGDQAAKTGLELVFDRTGADGKPESVRCNTPVILSDSNQIGLDQLKNTASVLAFGYGPEPQGGLYPRGKVPAGSLPTPFTKEELFIVVSTINGAGCPPVKVPSSTDPEVQKGNFPAVVDTQAMYTTIGPRTAYMLLGGCPSVKKTGTVTFPTNTGERTCDVLEGVEINFKLADGTERKCTLPVVVMDRLIIGGDQLEFLAIDLVIDPGDGVGRGGLFPKGKGPIDPWTKPPGEPVSKILRVESPLAAPLIAVSARSVDHGASLPTSSGILVPGGAVEPGLRFLGVSPE